MKKDIEAIIEKLKEMHGSPRVELNYSNPLELTVAVVLSAQCTDERVNRVTEHLFKKYRTLEDYLDAPEDELEEDIRPTGFYRNKARSLKSIAGELKERFGGPCAGRHRYLGHGQGHRAQIGQHDRRPRLREAGRHRRYAHDKGERPHRPHAEEEPDKIEKDLRPWCR